MWFLGSTRVKERHLSLVPCQHGLTAGSRRILMLLLLLFVPLCQLPLPIAATNRWDEENEFTNWLAVPFSSELDNSSFVVSSYFILQVQLCLISNRTGHAGEWVSEILTASETWNIVASGTWNSLLALYIHEILAWECSN